PRAARDLFGSEGHWPAPVVRDAVAATTRKGDRQPETRPGLPPPVPLVDRTVLHVAVARTTRDIVVASNTSIVVWKGDDGRVVPVTETLTDGVFGLGVDGSAFYVLVL